jgi:hypothetical protein
MHECENCGQACDCDGDDLWRNQPRNHACINPECDEEGDDYDMYQADHDLDDDL